MSRDNQFTSFAKMLITEMVNLHGYIDISGFWNGSDDETVQEYTQIIARRAYDLVYHTMSETTQAMAAYCEHRPAIKEEIRYIPDLVKWPEEIK